MMSGSQNKMHWFAAFAILMQVILPMPMASAETGAAHIEPEHLFCSQLEHPSEEVRATARELAHHLNSIEHTGDHDSHEAHCPLCVFMHGVPLSAGAPLIDRVRFSSTKDQPVHEPLVIIAPSGPPVGLRGPPVFA